MRQRLRRSSWVGALVCLTPLLVGVERPANLGDVREVRTWSHDDYTRVVVELSRPVEADVQMLGANPEAGRPDRLYVDLEGIERIYESFGIIMDVLRTSSPNAYDKSEVTLLISQSALAKYKITAATGSNPDDRLLELLKTNPELIQTLDPWTFSKAQPLN